MMVGSASQFSIIRLTLLIFTTFRMMWPGIDEQL